MRIPSASIVVLCSVVGVAGLQPEDKPRTFSVTGYGKVFYDANMCDMVVGVVTEHDDVIACRDAHDAKLRAIAGHMNEIEPDDVIFGTLGTELAIKGRGGSQNYATYYEYQTMYSIRLKDVARVSTLQSELVRDGVNRIHSVDLLSDELPTLTDRARRHAISDARSKAELAAEELGWTLGSAVNIQFREYGRASSSFGSRGSAGSGANKDAAEVFVDAGVTIMFEFSVAP